ncbi:MAG: hypothetical protein HY301_13485 [Verrucomicrobia bacterium]|nr:hypothetical protein [Verrucomicrobiota bacterium]
MFWPRANGFGKKSARNFATFAPSRKHPAAPPPELIYAHRYDDSYIVWYWSDTRERPVGCRQGGSAFRRSVSDFRRDVSDLRRRVSDFRHGVSDRKYLGADEKHHGSDLRHDVSVKLHGVSAFRSQISVRKCLGVGGKHCVSNARDGVSATNCRPFDGNIAAEGSGEIACR